MRCSGNRCVALVGEVGISTACAIYAVRPHVCRPCLPGDDGTATLQSLGCIAQARTFVQLSAMTSSDRSNKFGSEQPVPSDRLSLPAKD